MKKGFTLIEILAVVTIIGLIFILVIPKIATSLKNKKGDVDTTTNNIVLAAAKSYVQDNHDKFDKVDSNTYCLPISTLTKKEYLESPVKNVTDDVDITNIKSVKITYDKGFKYEVVDKKECEVVYIPPCESDYCDSNGNGYTEIEYAESIFGAYIDTEYIPQDFNDLAINYIAYIPGNTGYVVGLLSNGNYYGMRKNNDSSIRWHSPTGIYDINVNLTNNTYYNVLQDNNNLFIDGIKYEGNIITNVSEINSSHSLFIFARNNNGNADGFSRIRLKKLSIKSNNQIVRDYVPVKDTKNIICLFDKVEKKCYYNSGSGMLASRDSDLQNYYYDNLNNDYVEIEYLESTGTQYINTDYYANSLTEIDILFENKEGISGWNGIFGARDGNVKEGKTFCLFANGSNSSLALNYGNVDTSTISGTNASNKSNVKNIGTTFYYNDTEIKKFDNKPNLIGIPMYVLALNTNNSPRYSKTKLYYMKIRDNDTLVRDFVPVINSNGRPCLYDKVEHKCYYNQGTGEFLYG